jgi:hypothetical protein
VESSKTGDLLNLSLSRRCLLSHAAGLRSGYRDLASAAEADFAEGVSVRAEALTYRLVAVLGVGGLQSQWKRGFALGMTSKKS